MNYYYFCLPDNFNQGRWRFRESAPNKYLKYIASVKAKGKAWRAKNSHSQAATSITVIFLAKISETRPWWTYRQISILRRKTRMFPWYSYSPRPIMEYYFWIFYHRDIPKNALSRLLLRCLKPYPVKTWFTKSKQLTTVSSCFDCLKPGLEAFCRLRNNRLQCLDDLIMKTQR